nr:MFS transporter [Acinetobacter sp. Marseille-Q1620]
MMTTAQHDSKGHLFSIFIFSAICPFILMAAPVVAQQLGKEWGLSPSQIGLFFFVELGMMSLATFPGFLWSKRIPFKKAALYFSLIFIVGNLLSLFAKSFEFLLLTRFISAFAGGSIMIITISSCAYTSKPDKTYGLWILGQVIFGALALFFMPKLFILWGLNACFVVVIILMCLAIPFHRYFSSNIIQNKNINQVQNRSHTTPYKGKLSILAILLFYIGISGIWTFFSNIGQHAQIDNQFTNSVLAISTLIGIIGCFLPSIIGDKLNRKYFLTFGFALFFIALVLLFNHITQHDLMFSILLFKFAWMFTIPFVLATVSMYDSTGKYMNIINLVTGGGLAIGPVIAGKVIETSENYNSLILYSLILLVLSYLISLYCNFKITDEITKIALNKANHSK